MDAAVRTWARALEGLAIPEDILAAAPASPWEFPTEVFARAADEALGRETPTTRVAREALPVGGSVLDVGCGGGAASLPLAERAGRLVGVDESAELLAEFTSRARQLGVATRTVPGRWPDVAAAVGVADVVVSRNVAYNVPDLDGFVTELTARATHRVVLEITAEHPLAWLGPYWRELHELQMARGPVAADALAVIRATAVDPDTETWEDRSSLAERPEDEVVDLLQRRLCLADDRRAELEAALARHGVPRSRSVVTVWWEGAPAALS